MGSIGSRRCGIAGGAARGLFWRRCEGLWGFKGLKVPNSSFGRSQKRSAARTSGEVKCEALQSSRGGAGGGSAGV